MNKDALEAIQKRAEENWKEATAIREAMQGELTPVLEQQINKVDKSFMRKIFAFPNDITSTRIAKVIGKLLKL